MGKIIFLANIPSIICFAISGVLAYRQIDGWLWFLCAGILVTKSIKSE